MTNNLDPVDIALTFVGSNNRSPFNDWFYTQKGIVTAYCATFVSYCRSIGQMPLGKIDYTKGFAGVPFAVNFYKSKNQLTYKPVRNDICFFDWSGQKKNFEHTGLFIKDNGDGTFQSVEGNTSNPEIKASTSQSNGGYVMEKTRSYNTAIFAHPNN